MNISYEKNIGVGEKGTDSVALSLSGQKKKLRRYDMSTSLALTKMAAKF